MKKHYLTSLIAAILCIVAMGNVMTCYADDIVDDISYSEEISPCYIGIAATYCSLRPGNWGLMTCEGSTTVWSGYKGGVIVELQRYNNGWETIKSWSNINWNVAAVSQNWYVAHGYDYRVQTTHYSYDSAGNLLEVVIKYTDTVYY